MVCKEKKENNWYNMKAGVNDGFINLLFEWFQQKCADSILSDGPILHAKATDVAATMAISDFKVSNGWLYRLIKNDITSVAEKCLVKVVMLMEKMRPLDQQVSPRNNPWV